MALNYLLIYKFKPINLSVIFNKGCAFDITRIDCTRLNSHALRYSEIDEQTRKLVSVASRCTRYE